MANTTKLQRVMEYIEENPKCHTQDEWICGSGACFAGWTCLMGGWKWFRAKDWESADRVYKGKRPNILDTSATRHIQDVAIEILDLDYTDALILFWGNNTPKLLREMVDDLTHGEKLAMHWIPVVGAQNITSLERLTEKV